jgi:hypothetical protein
MPNFLATFSLAAFPLLVIGLFLLYRPPVATALSLLVSEMFLPPLYSLPLSSPTWLDKDTIPAIATFLVASLVARSSLRRSRPFRGIERFYIVMFVAAFMTMWTNRDPLRYGPTIVQGEVFSDFTSDTIRTVAASWMAFHLGRALFKTSRDLVSLCRLLALAGVIYSIPCLFEIRFSPVLLSKVYGYFNSHPFGMSVRWGGYRPTVFFDNGLQLTMFMLVCLVAALGLTRARKRLGVLPMTGVCLYLLAVLVLCKSTGAIIYAIIIVPLLTMASPRTVLKVCVVVTSFFVLYPLLRFADVIPTKAIGDYFTSMSADRAQSLSYRFDMEQGMLDLTRLRPLFGWGGYGRNMVWDPRSGHTITVVDGMVIATLSVRGLVGFFAYFGPFIVSVIRACRLNKRIKDRSSRVMLTALTLAGSVILFDLIINATTPPIFILLFGALYGLPSGIIAEQEAAAARAFEPVALEAAPA